MGYLHLAMDGFGRMFLFLAGNGALFGAVLATAMRSEGRPLRRLIPIVGFALGFLAMPLTLIFVIMLQGMGNTSLFGMFSALSIAIVPGFAVAGAVGTAILLAGLRLGRWQGEERDRRLYLTLGLGVGSFLAAGFVAAAIEALMYGESDSPAFYVAQVLPLAVLWFHVRSLEEAV